MASSRKIDQQMETLHHFQPYVLSVLRIMVGLCFWNKACPSCSGSRPAQVSQRFCRKLGPQIAPIACFHSASRHQRDEREAAGKQQHGGQEKADCRKDGDRGQVAACGRRRDGGGPRALASLQQGTRPKSRDTNHRAHRTLHIFKMLHLRRARHPDVSFPQGVRSSASTTRE